VDFKGDTKFNNAEFGYYTDVSNAKFVGGTDFGGAVFGRVTNFVNAEFRKESDFTGTEFGRVAGFNSVEFGGDSDFSNAQFGEGSNFEDTEFGGVADFDSVEFRGGSDFSNAKFREESNFEDTEFRRMVDFDSAEFEGDADFNNVEFGGDADFSNAEFSEEASFGESTIGSVGFEETVASVIELDDTTIHEGKIQQPEDSSTFYDFTGATLGDVTIRRENSEHDLFDHFRFYRTDFDGFDFTDYKDELSLNPQIHEFEYTPDDDSEEREEQPDELEATYLKAKDGAKKVGDHELASEFFVKEMQYRREKYKGELEEGGLEWGRRAKLKFDKRINWLYKKTSSYGEKPIRVISTSLLVVFFSMILYPAGGIQQMGNGTARILSYASASTPAEYLYVLGHSAYFSFVTFTTLGYGDLQPVGFSHILAMVESATGALLIALLIFVFGRSVKW